MNHDLPVPPLPPTYCRCCCGCGPSSSEFPVSSLSIASQTRPSATRWSLFSVISLAISLPTWTKLWSDAISSHVLADCPTVCARAGQFSSPPSSKPFPASTCCGLASSSPSMARVLTWCNRNCEALIMARRDFGSLSSFCCQTRCPCSWFHRPVGSAKPAFSTFSSSVLSCVEPWVMGSRSCMLDRISWKNCRVCFCSGRQIVPDRNFSSTSSNCSPWSSSPRLAHSCASFVASSAHFLRSLMLQYIPLIRCGNVSSCCNHMLSTVGSEVSWCRSPCKSSMPRKSSHGTKRPNNVTAIQQYCLVSSLPTLSTRYPVTIGTAPWSFSLNSWIHLSPPSNCLSKGKYLALAVLLFLLIRCQYTTLRYS